MYSACQRWQCSQGHHLAHVLDAGVRSLSIQGHLLSSGSGRGQLAFWDLRAGRYLDLDPLPGGEERRRHLQLGRGWLMEDSIYW